MGHESHLLWISKRGTGVASNTASDPFDIAVIDSQIAEVPFQEFLDQVRSFAHSRALPVVALYRLGSGSLLTVRENQLVAQLPKPVRMSELYNSLQAVFASETLPTAENCLSGKLRVACSDPVLIVDDNDINRLVAAEMLEQMGYAVATAANGAEAVEMVRDHRYFVVLMDCQMPDHGRIYRNARDQEDRAEHRSPYGHHCSDSSCIDG